MTPTQRFTQLIQPTQRVNQAELEPTTRQRIHTWIDTTITHGEDTWYLIVDALPLIGACALLICIFLFGPHR